jgi:hypothetical protein
MMPVEGIKRLAMTALTTPFAGAAIDDAALERSIDIQVAAGMDGLVIEESFGHPEEIEVVKEPAPASTALKAA